MSLGAKNLKTKAALKALVGQKLTEKNYVETAFIGGPEYKRDGSVTMVGPDAFNKRVWYATITLENGIITKVK